jgi:nitrogenase molybdenum-iron protein alpha chain
MTIVNLGNPQVEVREHRLGSITGFEGSASSLVGCSRGGSLCERNRSFSQCLGCSTSNAACTVILVQGAAVISHGPVGCSGCLHDFDPDAGRAWGVIRGLSHPGRGLLIGSGWDKLLATCRRTRDKGREETWASRTW